MKPASIAIDAVASFQGTTPCAMREITVLNRDGLHIQPAAELVALTGRYRSVVHFVTGGQSYGTASILDVLAADLRYGKSAVFIAEGPDAKETLDAVARFVAGLSREAGSAPEAWHWPNHLQSGGAELALKRVA